MSGRAKSREAVRPKVSLRADDQIVGPFDAEPRRSVHLVRQAARAGLLVNPIGGEPPTVLGLPYHFGRLANGAELALIMPHEACAETAV